MRGTEGPKRPCLRLTALLLWLLAGCALSGSPVTRGAVPGRGATGIAGKVLDAAHRPAAGALVFAYRTPKGGLRGPADFAAEVGPDGRYFLDLVEGHYWLVARLRPGGRDAGPPRPGDAWAIFPDNPVSVAPGRISRADFLLQGASRFGLGRVGSLVSGDTGFTGQVVDRAGRPVAGVMALAYPTPDFHRMPDFTSTATGGEGRFHLYLPAGGRYCLAVRGGHRGQPRPGELYGTLGAGEAACRTVAAGRMVDVGTIVVTPYQR